MTNNLVHLCREGFQPDVRILCSGAWTTPKWGDGSTTTPGVYQAENGDYYTFDAALATCERCVSEVPR